jgi:hypothetical protein
MRSISLVLTCLTILSATTQAFAARDGVPAAVVELDGVRYIAANNTGLKAVVEARDARSEKVLWKVVVYRDKLIPELEEDVQWIFVTSMEAVGGELVLIDERCRVHTVSLKTHKVKHKRSLKRAVDGSCIRS